MEAIAVAAKDEVKGSGSQFASSQANAGKIDDNAKDIKLEGFSINAHGKLLFDNANLTIVHGRRYGLVGPNGQGKTTLLAHISQGVLAIPKSIDVLHVEQECEASDMRAIDAVIKADTKRTALLDEEKQLMDKLDNAKLSEAESEAITDRLKEVGVEMQARGVDQAEATVRKILSGLGFTAKMQEQPTKHFSGGWRMRISLAQALFIEPTLLLLDEPTNHLDLNAVIWLDSYLQTWKKTLLIVSHDQDFLNSICTDMLHLDQKKLHHYRGNYEDFKKMYIQRKREQEKEYEKMCKKLKAEKAKGTSKKDAEAKMKKDRERGARSKKGGKSDQDGSSADAIAAENIERPREYVVHFEFPEPPDLTPPILSMKEVGFHYTVKDEAGPQLFTEVEFGVDTESRIAIVGPNGVGKSTFLNLMTGLLEPTEGQIDRNRHLRIGRYNQHFVDKLPIDKTAVGYLRDKYGDLVYQDARRQLGRYGLEGHAHEIPMRDLSGGQKARVQFLDVALSTPHILFFDEPTNHLDIESIDALCEALNEYSGGVVLVSHDARLISEVDCDLYVCDEKNVKKFEGGLDEYREKIIRDLEEQEEEYRTGTVAEKKQEVKPKTVSIFDVM